MILRVLLYGLIFYLLYKFIFDFLVPVVKTTQQVKKGFQQMQNQMNQFQQQQTAAADTKSADTSPKETAGEYIDFEEVK
jgi:hypothetical protein